MIKKFFIVFIFPIFLFVSCSQTKKIVYLKNIDTLRSNEYVFTNQFDYRIQKQDLLYIDISTINPDINQLFSDNNSVSQSFLSSEIGLYIQSYYVNDSGYIELPVLGKLKVENLTLEEVKETIKNSGYFLKNPVINVKLLSFKVSILGEVMRPGVYKNYGNKLTIFEAIGLAGDINDYGNRKNVMVLRPTETGTKIIHLDLTNKNLFNSEAYYLRPNDIIYVQPRKNKLFKINAQIYTMVISGISTLVLVLNLVLRKV
jgi:polysaccharide export outer membrane protein